MADNISEGNAGQQKEGGKNPTGPGQESTKKKLNLQLILMIVILLLLLGGAAAFLFLTPMGSKLLGKYTEHGPSQVAPKDLVFFPIPELLVNLATNQKVKKPPFLRLVVKLELGSVDDSKIMELVRPRIIDQFQIFLRSLRVEDIEGSAGIQRLREELLKRVNTVAAPAKARDVLFEVMLIQ